MISPSERGTRYCPSFPAIVLGQSLPDLGRHLYRNEVPCTESSAVSTHATRYCGTGCAAPWVDPDDSAAGYVLATDSHAFGRNMFLYEKADRRMETHRFLDDSIEVRQLEPGFSVADRVA